MSGEIDMPEEASTQGRFSRVRNWYARWERPLSSISLVGGFVFDALTLKRVDLFWENFWVVAHLLIVAICIVWINREEKGVGHETDPAKIHFWLVNILQFFFGGLLSTFLVFYFRSGTVGASWPFLLILAAAFIANESFKKHYTRLAFQIALLYLSIFCFAIFLVPVVLHEIGPWIFLLSGVVSLVTIGIFIAILSFFSREKISRTRWSLYLPIFLVFAGMNLLYFYNLIPPIPLSLKDGGIYHSLIANGPGNYTVAYEDQGPFDFFDWYDNEHLVASDALYAYSSVFSPPLFSMNIVHEWQWYDPGTHAWVTRGRINLAVIGGSDGGYRTYSEESNLAPGAWRVNVETTQGAVIGRLNFTVIATGTEPTLETENID